MFFVVEPKTHRSGQSVKIASGGRVTEGGGGVKFYNNIGLSVKSDSFVGLRPVKPSLIVHWHHFPVLVVLGAWSKHIRLAAEEWRRSGGGVAEEWRSGGGVAEE